MKNRRSNWIKLRFAVLLNIFFLQIVFSCNKMVAIPNPSSSITAGQVFSSDATATAAILGIYSYMSSIQAFSNSQMTIFGGESADELTNEPKGDERFNPFLINGLTALKSSNNVLTYFWQPAYFDIYSANAIISGVDASTDIHPSVKNQLIGEAKFIRAFCYFYLTNLFGNVPLDLSPDFNQTVLLPNTPQINVYQQIVADLQDAQNLLIDDFSFSNGQPTRANKWAALALLARVYLYQGNWVSADSAASAVINSGRFNLVDDLNKVFLANSSEAILQLQTANYYPYATIEGNYFVPPSTKSSVDAWLTSQLLGAFEPNDLRRLDWVDSNVVGGTVYYYPYKYKIFSASSGNVTENYTMLRLAEQYLIRAEADANLGQLGSSIGDLDTLRSRAKLPGLSASLSQSQVLAAIQQEWRIEFFAEWGHRWLDLKRWGIAVSALDTILYKHGNIDATQLLYPIPISETQKDPNLNQNPGYTN